MNDPRRRPLSTGAFLAMLLVTLTLLIQAVFDNYEMRLTRKALDGRFAQQHEPMEKAKTLREQLEGIAGAVAALAEQGNPNAILIRDQLQKQGITIRPR